MSYGEFRKFRSVGERERRKEGRKEEGMLSFVS